MLNHLKLLAIGGGEIGGRNGKIDTRIIDAEIQKLVAGGKILFLAPISKHAHEYAEWFLQNYQNHVCVDIVYLSDVLDGNISMEILKGKFRDIEAVYIGGGNTLRIINALKGTGVDNLITDAMEKGVLISGISAGAMCLFKYGCSDSQFAETGKMTLLKGLGYIDCFFCPHYDSEPERKPFFEKMLQDHSNTIGLALDDGCAFFVNNGNYKILACDSTSHAHLCYWKNNKFYCKILPLTDWQPLELLSKLC